MGFFSDLKEDLSQAVSELQPDGKQVKPGDGQNTKKPAISLNEMLENIDSVELDEEDLAGTEDSLFREPESAEKSARWETSPVKAAWERFVTEYFATENPEKVLASGGFDEEAEEPETMEEAAEEGNSASAEETVEEQLQEEPAAATAAMEEDSATEAVESPAEMAKQPPEEPMEQRAVEEAFPVWSKEPLMGEKTAKETLVEKRPADQSLEEGADRQATEEGAKKQPPEESVAKQPLEESAKKQLPEESVAKQSLEEGAKKQPPEEGAGKQPLEEGAKKQPPEEGADRQAPEEGMKKQPLEEGADRQTTEESTGKQSLEEGARKQPPEESADKQSLEEGAKKQPPEETTADDIPAGENILADMKEQEKKIETERNENMDTFSMTGTIQEQESEGAEETMETVETMEAMEATEEKRVAVDETAIITAAMVIKGDISTEGSIDVIGTVNGNIDALGKLNITGHIIGNSKAAEIFAESAKINGEIVSEGAVKIGASSVIIGNITATSAVIAGAVKGDIDVHGPVILDTSAIVMGNIKSKSVQMNNGAVIEGMCSQCYADVSPTTFFNEYKLEPVRKSKSK